MKWQNKKSTNVDKGVREKKKKKKAQLDSSFGTKLPSSQSKNRSKDPQSVLTFTLPTGWSHVRVSGEARDRNFPLVPQPRS